jgi:hypothetical protein
MGGILKTKEVRRLGMCKGKKISAHRIFVKKPLVLYPL